MIRAIMSVSAGQADAKSDVGHHAEFVMGLGSYDTQSRESWTKCLCETGPQCVENAAKKGGL